jgi:hypothetical protein
MAQHTQSTQSVQVGIEGTTPVAAGVQATKKILSFGFDLNPEQVYDKYRPNGFKYDTVASLSKEWAGGAFTGRATYDEMLYALASVLTNPTPTAGAGATAGTTSWLFAPDSSLPDTPLFFTVEQGDSTLSYRTTQLVIKDLTLKIDRNTACEISGNVIGKGYFVGITNRTTGATSLTGAPTIMQPGQVSMFMDPTYGALGTTQLLNCDLAELKIANRFDAWWALNNSLTSFSDIVEQVPDVKLSIACAADSQSIGILGNARLGQTLFFRVLAQGPEIGNTGVFNKLTFDFAGKVDAVPKGGVTTNVLTHTWEFVAVHDGGWGKAMTATLVNAVGATALAADTTLAAVVPVLTSAAPNVGVPHATSTEVVITGVGFTGATAVSFGGTAAVSFVVISDTKIEAMTSAAMTTGAKAVVVTNATGPSVTVLNVTFS